MRLDKDNFPGKYDSWERGTVSPRLPKLNTEGSFCPDCRVVMIPSAGCFMCPVCGRGNAKCGG